ncbi:hypothetical protein E1295_41345 [Nonomuraea mesophila]|uniref:Uncharacterized protein n=1 Tax=Nonomuraea mesophila TaxID=2530382 RepID=A0A4R5EBC0_9ACTN|nr:hypothetical protein [Nonomuraea mesophila]TDE30105.1 hypothetical protein E1295_41345 [Nonomuraea mesophila]
MELVNDHLAVKARLVEPNDRGYLLFAAETGTWRGPFPTSVPPLDELKAIATQLAARPEVEDATVFRARLRPPGEGEEILTARGIAPARYDVVLLVRTTDVGSALALRDDPLYTKATTLLPARRTHQIAGRNAARLGDVDHGPDHAFLFNYFYADDRETLLKIWEYTAGWFQAKTALPNSTLLQPLDGESTDYGIINHASWPALPTFLPSLILRPTFRSFVLANFQANGIAAQPIIYRRI